MSSDAKFTAQVDKPIVLFLIGGQVNNILRVYKWFYIAWAYLSMIRWLRQHPESGYLSGHLYLRVFPFGMMLMSYWRSWEDLEAFARFKDGTHLKTWVRYMHDADSSMAIWHETYAIEPGKFEVVYGNTVPYGLSKATHPIPVSGRQHNGRGRLNPDDMTVSEAPLVPLPDVFK
jgi:hypothetical protein